MSDEADKLRPFRAAPGRDDLVRELATTRAAYWRDCAAWVARRHNDISRRYNELAKDYNELREAARTILAVTDRLMNEKHGESAAPEQPDA